MLEHVEQTHQIESRTERMKDRVALHQTRAIAAAGDLQPLRESVHADHQVTAAGAVQVAQHVPIAAANLENLAALGERTADLGYQFREDAVARMKPKMAVFDPEQLIEIGGIVAGPRRAGVQGAHLAHP